MALFARRRISLSINPHPLSPNYHPSQRLEHIHIHALALSYHLIEPACLRVILWRIRTAHRQTRPSRQPSSRAVGAARVARIDAGVAQRVLELLEIVNPLVAVIPEYVVDRRRA